jgi:hypothetical protein
VQTPQKLSLPKNLSHCFAVSLDAVSRQVFSSAGLVVPNSVVHCVFNATCSISTHSCLLVGSCEYTGVKASVNKSSRLSFVAMTIVPQLYDGSGGSVPPMSKLPQDSFVQVNQVKKNCKENCPEKR